MMDNTRHSDLPSFWRMCELAKQKQEQKKQTAEFRTSNQTQKGRRVICKVHHAESR